MKLKSLESLWYQRARAEEEKMKAEAEIRKRQLEFRLELVKRVIEEVKKREAGETHA